MYYTKKEVSSVGTRKLVTISLPPPRLKKAEERLFALINRVQARASRTPTREIRKLVREAVESVRREKQSRPQLSQRLKAT